MTPEEKTVAYREMQLGVYMNFVKDFQEDEKMLVAEMELATNDSNTIPPDRLRDMEKREREELKRLEKQVFRREIKEIEEAYTAGNLKQLRDNMTKSINECILKQQRAFAKVQAMHDEQQSICQKKRQDIQTAMKKKTLLQNLCNNLLEKNCELYLKHEEMLDEERKQRQLLASNFGDQMKEVQVELDEQKAKRQKEIDENGELRKQIQTAIDQYREKEAAYRAKMDVHGKLIGEIEKKLKSTIEGTLNSSIKQAEAEKAKFMKVVGNTKELTEKINSFMQKFDQIKDEMNENSRKFESYQQSIETKKLEISTLETEIENISLMEKKHKKA